MTDLIDNYRGVRDNVFGGRGDVSIFAVPAERKTAVRLPPIEGPDSDWQSAYSAFLTNQNGAE